MRRMWGKCKIEAVMNCALQSAWWPSMLCSLKLHPGPSISAKNANSPENCPVIAFNFALTILANMKYTNIHQAILSWKSIGLWVEIKLMAFSFLAFSCTQPLALRNLLTIATLRVSLKLPARPVETYLGNRQIQRLFLPKAKMLLVGCYGGLVIIQFLYVLALLCCFRFYWRHIPGHEIIFARSNFWRWALIV